MNYHYMKRLLLILLLLTLTVSIAIPQDRLRGGARQRGGVKLRTISACSFPCTSILDNFNRPNEGPPPSASWTTAWRPSTTGWKVVSNSEAQVETGGNDNSTYWNTNIGPNFEVYVTITAGAADYLGLAGRLVSEGTAGVDGYEVIAFSGNTIGLYRWDNNVQSAAIGGTFSQSYTTGDSFGMSVTGSTFTIYFKAAAGSWTSLGTRNDATYSATGKLGLRGGSVNVDNFGGGAL
jgi:hypothetical protein